MPAGLTSVSYLGGLRVAHLDVITTLATVILLGALAAVLRRSRVGLQLRAAAEDFITTRMMGIRASHTIAIAFLITGFLDGVVTLLIAARTGAAYPDIGLQPLLIGFVAIVLGGLGSLEGAVVGGYVVGLLSGLLQAFLPAAISPFQTTVLFALIVAILLLRRQGFL